jgi:hypothetical protein
MLQNGDQNPRENISLDKQFAIKLHILFFIGQGESASIPLHGNRKKIAKVHLHSLVC